MVQIIEINRKLIKKMTNDKKKHHVGVITKCRNRGYGTHLIL